METIFEIVIITEKEFTTAEKYDIMCDFSARLHGYHTECPEVLKGRNIILREIEITHE